MMESSQGGAELCHLNFRILYLARAKGGARAPSAPPGYASVHNGNITQSNNYYNIIVLPLIYVPCDTLRLSIGTDMDLPCHEG